MCLVISRKRARQEIVMVLKDWRRYGIRDVQVDKERNIVFARVGPKNCESHVKEPSRSLFSFRPIRPACDNESSSR